MPEKERWEIFRWNWNGEERESSTVENFLNYVRRGKRETCEEEGDPGRSFDPVLHIKRRDKPDP